MRKTLWNRAADKVGDVVVTLICWTYFTFGFLLFFSPGYLVASLFSSDRERAFQQYNSSFYKGFFKILQWVAPRQQWVIDEGIAAIRSSVIICNHLSYLDPLLLIAFLNPSKTVVKTLFFKVPIFGWVIRTAGYLPATAQGQFSPLMIAQLDAMEAYLATGGNLFVFPEGTRSRDGRVGKLNRGAMKIARLCRAPLYVLRLDNTDKLFTPGKFFFNTRESHTIRAAIVDRIEPDEQRALLSLSALEDRVQRALRQ